MDVELFILGKSRDVCVAVVLSFWACLKRTVEVRVQACAGGLCVVGQVRLLPCQDPKYLWLLHWMGLGLTEPRELQGAARGRCSRCDSMVSASPSGVWGR